MELSPSPQSSIYTFLLEASGVGCFLKRLLTSHPSRNLPFIDFLLEALGVGYFFRTFSIQMFALAPRG